MNRLGGWDVRSRGDQDGQTVNDWVAAAAHRAVNGVRQQAQRGVAGRADELVNDFLGEVHGYQFRSKDDSAVAGVGNPSCGGICLPLRFDRREWLLNDRAGVQPRLAGSIIVT